LRRPTHITVTKEDQAILIRDVKAGLESTQVGFEDAEKTFAQQISALQASLRLPIGVLESALWSSNLLNEIGEWYHPRDPEITFGQWTESMVAPLQFDTFWNTIDKDE
jgi:hypothetical protein